MPRMSSEFAGFVRDTAVRAFDLLSERVKEVPTPLRPILRAWTKLSSAQKNELFDEMIGLVRGGDETPPAKTRKKAAKKR